MSQIVFNVAAMLPMLVLTALAGLAIVDDLHRAASPWRTIKRPTARRGFSSSYSARSMALRVALSLPGIASRQARSSATAMSVCEIMIEQPQLRQRDWGRLA